GRYGAAQELRRRSSDRGTRRPTRSTSLYTDGSRRAGGPRGAGRHGVTESETASPPSGSRMKTLLLSQRSAAALIISASLIFMAAGLWSGPPLSAQVAPPSTQADRFVAKLLQNRYALSVHSGQLSGAGAQVLQSAIAQSRFVLLGEEHGVAQT